jgi:transcriptional regulator with XRE-family HTH domain
MTTSGGPAVSGDAAARLSARIRSRRRALGVSQEDAAGRTGVTLRTWQRWESGATKGHVLHLPTIARALETTSEWLLGTAEAGADREESGDFALERRLRRIEATQTAILRALDDLRGEREAPDRQAPG